ncbi:MAG: glucosamine-6-phosphate deaminase [Saprospiraceae bacterium]|nr:glucosamine-6-phosphate deaminase [Saprospiraceae bacterium]MCF8250904.1 glucosamine-6-phosphate deaminase [Saprospiraceae bacterium]MCF8282709.1 glucosamine-6-phosphate deaminase [Bacteroidales bacterium]MCF8311869.1 glucosamine-6-phosphate deaminase [Saprospiraceae bacterium]MCF8443017.1 glucosamine-6-phosphate deaminase [Saprospiraceae bacterium]
MQLKIFADYEALSDYAANAMLAAVEQKPDSLIGIVSGDSPRLAYDLFVEKALENDVDTSKLCFAGFDEWVGIPPENEGSCHAFLHRHVFTPLHLPKENYHVFDAMSADLDCECQRMNEFIAQRGGLDLLLVGVGMNGHIGFNEPGVDFGNYAHVQLLEEITLKVGQKYFQAATELKHGITLGLRHLTEAKQVLMLANGQKKAAIMQQALEGKIGNQLPASIIRSHANSSVLLDVELAAAIRR